MSRILPTQLLQGADDDDDSGDGGGGDSGHEEDGGGGDEVDYWKLPPLPPPGLGLRLPDGSFVAHGEDVGDDDVVHYRDDDVTEQHDDRPLIPDLADLSAQQSSCSHLNGYQAYRPRPLPPHVSQNNQAGFNHSNTVNNISDLHRGHGALPRTRSGENSVVGFFGFFCTVSS